MKSAGKARNNGLYRHIRTSKEIIRNLLNDLRKQFNVSFAAFLQVTPEKPCFKVFRLSFLINFDYYKKIYNK